MILIFLFTSLTSHILQVSADEREISNNSIVPKKRRTSPIWSRINRDHKRNIRTHDGRELNKIRRNVSAPREQMNFASARFANGIPIKESVCL